MDDIQWQMKLIECFLAEFQVSQRYIARPDADIEMFGIKVLDIHAQKAVQQVGHETFQHCELWRPSPWPEIGA